MEAGEPRRGLAGHIGARLEPPELERAFRQVARWQDVPRLTVLLTASAALTAIFGCLELFTLDEGARVLAASARAADVPLILGGLAYIRLRRTPEAIDRVLWLLLHAHVVHMLVISSLGSYDVTALFMWDVATIFGVYLLLPTRLSTQVTGCTLLVLGEIALWLLPPSGAIEATDTFAIVLAFGWANCLGIWASAQQARARRDRFVARIEELRDTVDLEKALEEISLLRGIVPICMHCKKMRNDDGFWEQLEQYLASRSDAAFSHGICPGCAEEHYAGYALLEEGAG